MNRIICFFRSLYYKLQISKDNKRGLDFFDTQNFNESDYNTAISVQYEPSRSGFESVFNSLSISDKDSILDIGCGKGKAIALLSKYPFKNIDGYDISESLCNIARKNLSILGIINSEVFCANALEFTAYDKYNYFYLYNPVPATVFVTVFESINKSFERNPRKIHIINVNPQYSEIILENQDYKLVKVIKSDLLRYIVHYYSNSYNG